MVDPPRLKCSRLSIGDEPYACNVQIFIIVPYVNSARYELSKAGSVQRPLVDIARVKHTSDRSKPGVHPAWALSDTQLRRK